MGLVAVVYASAQIQEITSPTGSEISYNLYDEEKIVHSSPWQSMASQFGMHEYAGSLTGRLVVLKGDDYLCDFSTASDVPDETKVWLNSPPETLSAFGNILLVERGRATDEKGDHPPCVFTEKVAIAEKLGAKAVIIWDFEEEPLFTMWDPDEVFGTPIDIPSVLISNSHGLELIDKLTDGKWNEKTRYDKVDSLKAMTVTVRWGLPHPDGKVELDYYTCADDFKSMSFKANFPDVIPAFGNSLEFTPHYFILDGSKVGCRGVGEYCGDQCSNNGRYCVEDPDMDVMNGLSGFDVLEEDLRQICVWKYQQSKAKSGVEDQEEETLHWFKYVDFFNNNCLGDIDSREVDEEKFHKKCSIEQMDKVDVNMWKFVEKCIDDSGGLGVDLDEDNPVFEAELNMAVVHDIFSCPQVVVNNFRLSNKWDCPPGFSINNCETFRSVCAGFAAGTTPDICGGSPGCPAGEYIDSCQMCLKKSDPRFDASCVDCAGFINGAHTVQMCSFGKEICAEPGDEFESECKQLCKWNSFDACGVCADPSGSDFKDPTKYPNAVLDCNGDCAGTAVYDCSGECGGLKVSYCDDCIESSDPRIGIRCDQYQSCDTGIFDACGDCVQKGTTDYLKPSEHPGVVKDCSGVCGGSMIDHCGSCLESTDPKGTISCNKLDTCDSGIFDACGDCVIQGQAYIDPTEFPNARKDCEGICLGTKVVYCGYCIEREDPRIGKECDSYVPTPSASGSSHTQLSLIVSMVCALVILVTGIIYFMWRRMNKQETEFRRLMSEYTLLDDSQKI